MVRLKAVPCLARANNADWLTQGFSTLPRNPADFICLLYFPFPTPSFFCRSSFSHTFLPAEHKISSAPR
jgi:hypothetical protein